MELKFTDTSIVVLVDFLKLLHQLPLHIVMQSLLRDALVDCVRLGQPIADIYIVFERLSRV